MKRDPVKLALWRKRSKTLRAVSPRRASEARERIHVRNAVFQRDLWACQVKALGVFAGKPYEGCHGILTFGHVVKASQGGSFSEANGAALCIFHNSIIESSAEAARLAHEAGLLRYGWEGERCA